MNVSMQGTDQLEPKTVWYAGTDQLFEGYALCYDVAATIGGSGGDPKTGLGIQVVKPATANLMAFAGVLAVQSAGKTGPCFVDIVPHYKNRFVRAYTKLNQTAFSSAFGPINNDYALGTFADATLNLGFVGISAQTIDTSGTAAVTLLLYK